MPRHALIVCLSISVLSGIGCSLLVQDAEEVELLDNAFEATITATGKVQGTDVELEKVFRVCMPGDLNPNQNGGDVPTSQDLQGYCDNVLVPIARKMLQECQGDELKNFAFTCELNPVEFLEAACEQECCEQLLLGDCSNLDDATAVTGVAETACLAEFDPESECAQPMGSTMERRSTCEATGALGSTVTVVRGGDAQAQPAEGIVEFSGDLSPGSQVSVSSSLEDVGNFSFDAFGGIADATLKNIFASSSSIVTSAIGPNSVALFGPFTTVTTGGGDLEKPLSPDDSGEFVLKNAENVVAGIDLVNGSCSLESSVEADDDGTPVEINTELHGTFVNRPATANAGDDEAVECTSPDGAEVFLDCSGSTDPDGNIVAHQWRVGSRTGPELGVLDDTVITQQAFDTLEEYHCNVVDGFFQISTDSKLVRVVDTTAPAIDCNVPLSIEPPDATISFTATAGDICDPDAAGTVAISGFNCFLMHKDRIIDKSESCEVLVDGATITIVDAGGVGTHIVWTVTATDASGNEAIEECGLVIDRPGP
jgi:hypothetical protein